MPSRDLKVSPAELTWKSGVDVLSFGATKNGAMMLEAVVFFDTKLADDFIYRRMRGGQLVSKGRYLGAQMLAYLKDDLWLENAKLANGLAAQLADGLRQIQKNSHSQSGASQRSVCRHAAGPERQAPGFRRKIL